MKNEIKKAGMVIPFLCLFLVMLPACGPSVLLTASWSDTHVQPVRFSKILVLAFGKDLEKRKLGEDHIKRALQDRGIAAATGLDEFGPEFAGQYDSTKMRQVLLDRQFDGVMTIRVLNIHEQDRWVPGGVYYGPIGYYRGFYGYYHRVWGYYEQPGYTVTNVEVLLESNLYRVETGDLLWSGQSKAFSRNPTAEMATEYAKNIVDDVIRKRVITAGEPVAMRTAASRDQH